MVFGSLTNVLIYGAQCSTNVFVLENVLKQTHVVSIFFSSNVLFSKGVRCCRGCFERLTSWGKEVSNTVYGNGKYASKIVPTQHFAVPQSVTLN